MILEAVDDILVMSPRQIYECQLKTSLELLLKLKFYDFEFQFSKDSSFFFRRRRATRSVTS